MTFNLPLLYFVWNEEHCQTSPNKNKSTNLWHLTSIKSSIFLTSGLLIPLTVVCIFGWSFFQFFEKPTTKQKYHFPALPITYQYFFGKISGISPWVSRINWCKVWCGLSFIVIRLSAQKRCKNTKNAILPLFWALKLDSLTTICPSLQFILLTHGPILEIFAKKYWELAELENDIFWGGLLDFSKKMYLYVVFFLNENHHGFHKK